MRASAWTRPTALGVDTLGACSPVPAKAVPVGILENGAAGRVSAASCCNVVGQGRSSGCEGRAAIHVGAAVVASAAPPAVALAGRPDTHGTLEGVQFCLVRIGEGLGTVLENERVVVGEVVEDAVALCHLIDTRAHHRHHWVTCALV